MFKKSFALYRSLIACLLSVSLLWGCASLPPYQQISEAKQALGRAEISLPTPKDKIDYNNAKLLLEQAETAMSIKDYISAEFLSRQSMAVSRQLIQKNNTEKNIQFRY